MGRSATSCFKIISCAGSDDSVDRDEIDASNENKGQRGWSFRKRSARHRVLSNTVVTEQPSSDNKTISEPITTISSHQIIPNISEKTADNIWTEEIPDTPAKNATVSTITTESAIENDVKCKTDPDESKSKSEYESSVLVIQAAVRRFLAQRRFVKQKNIVKLQAAVRGHLVRSHAVGTLRCVQAIVKMQALVRARQQKGVKNAGINSNRTHISIEKLLSNRLACQLLESTPKGKQINIKCEPLKADSAWNWLERWMSVSAPETFESREPEHDQNEVIIKSENEGETVIPCKIVEITVPSEEKENSVIIEEEIDLKIHKEEDEEEIDLKIHKEEDPLSESILSETEPETEPIPKNPVSETEIKLIPKISVSEIVNEPKLIPENPVSEPEPEPKRKSVSGSRKAINPAFIAAQSRFEELTSKNNNPLKSPNSSNENSDPEFNPVKPPLDSSNPNDDSSNPTLVTNNEPEEYLVNHGSRAVQTGGSECGTELSVTSALDSPDQFEIGIKEFEEKPDNEKLKPATNVEVDNREPDDDIELEPKSGHHIHKSHTEPESVHEPETVQQVSVEGSPRSHITFPESQGTPSSQLSTNTKKSKTGSSQKRKSWSTSKKSSVDSGQRSSLEQLPKDPKPGKRRNSFGSPKPDKIDEEGRDNNCVPSYMQATESAKLKAVANISPRSSPDLQDKEINLRKRHSLPGGVNGRQGSPRIQRSMSQALQNTKGNVAGTERKWQR